ncbi:hypothetical protein PFICI_09546 [Pestalotiopsis fici W106-1]|uniref:Xylanolytic transcriptional activator regulatory domain-containing protein n=1 Tax=Pestalotiopsis fici (strain W106-1 / CGMCC3.15140) TaxID=1229662 RepID=W3X0N4_PESFW|nr:uncharacterized protein PFICI_09546 [Pestalotiopsis fici W106-1]ETS79693.1 hypothetical protein PFICI_09546 [Pestalotiopsis fici W106-1]
MASQSKVGTCVNCRQMKVRILPYIALEERAEDIEKELREIKSNATHASPTPTANLRTYQQGSGHSPAEPLPIISTPQSFANNIYAVPEYGSCFIDSAFETRRIGELELSPVAIADILNCYFTSYHHLFPILSEPSIFYLNYPRCSQLLFWVLIAIASKSIPKYSQLHLQLEPHVRTLATSTEEVVDHPLGTVQALLLLCWWPFPFKALREDPSWMYAGSATHIALRSGLHRPCHFSDFVYGDRLDAMGVLAFTKAWIGCFIVNQIISSELGLPCTVPLDSTILSVVRGTSEVALPTVLVQQLKIAYQSYNICNILGNNDLSSSGLLAGSTDMMRIFERGIQEVETQIGDKMSTYTEMALLKVKLQLYSFAFTADTQNIRIDSRASKFLSKAGRDATQVIATAAQHAPSHRPLQPWPATARSSIVYAVHVLLRLLAFPEHLDQDTAKNYIGQAWVLLHSRSELENDSWARLCDIITYLSSADSTKDPPMVAPVQARMSANIVVQSIWQARGRFSEDVLRQRPRDYTAAEARRDLTQFGLDLLSGTLFLDSTPFDDISNSILNLDKG